MWDDCLNFITLTTGVPEHDRLEYLRVAKAYEKENDFEMAKIMADSDMRAVSKEIHNAYSGCLNAPEIEHIQDYINFLNDPILNKMFT